MPVHRPLEASRVWVRARASDADVLTAIERRATDLTGTREEARLQALCPAFAALRRPHERRSALGALHSHAARADDALIAALELRPVPGPACVRPDLALGIEALTDDGTSFVVVDIVDGKARTAAAVNACTAREAWLAEKPEHLPTAVREHSCWWRDARGRVVVNQVTAYRYAPAGQTRHRWLPPGWSLDGHAGWIFLTADPPRYRAYAPGWRTPNLEHVAAALLRCHLREPRAALAEALAHHIAPRGTHEYVARHASRGTSRSSGIARTWPAAAWRGEIASIEHDKRTTSVAYVAGWKLLLDGRALGPADVAADADLRVEAQLWQAELVALGERGWGPCLTAGCACRCEHRCTCDRRCGHVDQWGTLASTGRQAS